MLLFTVCQPRGCASNHVIVCSARYLSPESLLQSNATASCGLCCLKVQLEKGSQPNRCHLGLLQNCPSHLLCRDTEEIKINSWPVLFSITVDVQQCKDHPASPWWAFQILATVNMQRTGWLYNMTLTQPCAFLSFPFLFCLLFSDTVSCGPGSVARMCLNSPIFLPPPPECLGYGCESVSLTNAFLKTCDLRALKLFSFSSKMRVVEKSLCFTMEKKVLFLFG